MKPIRIQKCTEEPERHTNGA